MAPPQLFATEIGGHAADQLRKAVASGHHVSLFMGKSTLEHIWPDIVRWLRKPVAVATPRAATSTLRSKEPKHSAATS